VLTVVLMASACSQSETAANPVDDDVIASGQLAFGIQRCDTDAKVLAADPVFYRDEPIYVGNEQPVEQVRAWARTRPGYQDIWIDRDHNGWIGVGFSEDADVRQAELEAEFLDEETLALFEPLAGPMLCVEGTDPVDAVCDGPQLVEGDGWRLLGNDLTGPSYRTGVATAAEQYRELWAQAGLFTPSSSYPEIQPAARATQTAKPMS